MMYPTATAGKKKKKAKNAGFRPLGALSLHGWISFLLVERAYTTNFFMQKKKTFKVFVILNEVFESILG